MKKIKSIFELLFLFLLIIFVSTQISCVQKIKGNKYIKKEVREMGPFNKLDIFGVGTFYLSQGDKESVTVEIDNNLLKYITTEITDNKLVIDTKVNSKIKKTSKLKIYVQLKDINQLTVDAVGNVKCTSELKLDKVDIRKRGVGNLMLKGEANEVTLKNSGVGNVNAYDFIVKNMNVKNNGVGNLKIYVTGQLSLKNSGVGNINYKGDAVIKEINFSGVGNVSKKND